MRDLRAPSRAWMAEPRVGRSRTMHPHTHQGQTSRRPLRFAVAAALSLVAGSVAAQPSGPASDVFRVGVAVPNDTDGTLGVVPTFGTPAAGSDTTRYAIELPRA